VKLLFDENLSPALPARIADLFPNSEHVRNLGLARAPDPLIWQHALNNGFTIVSKDEDFHHLSFLHGAPPKVIGLSLGNCSTASLERLLRDRFDEVTLFASDPTAAFLPLP
jgi:predicted nuclease of predicted toxin-antitoxin system